MKSTNKTNKTKPKTSRHHDYSTDIIHKLLHLRARHPDWRMGQIIANGVREATGAVNCDPFHLDDELFDAGLEALIIND